MDGDGNYYDTSVSHYSINVLNNGQNNVQQNRLRDLL